MPAAAAWTRRRIRRDVGHASALGAPPGWRINIIAAICVMRSSVIHPLVDVTVTKTSHPLACVRSYRAVDGKLVARQNQRLPRNATTTSSTTLTGSVGESSGTLNFVLSH